MKEVEKLIKEYESSHPDAVSPRGYLTAFGMNKLIDMIKGSKGKEIVFFDNSDNFDFVRYSYKK